MAKTLKKLVSSTPTTLQRTSKLSGNTYEPELNKFSPIFSDEFFQSAESNPNSSIQIIDDEDLVVEDEYFADNFDDFMPEGDAVGEWIGCANHKLQLPLKFLETDETFVEVRDTVVGILRSLRRSTLALNALREMTSLCVVLPVSTR
jgi:hypothetical protein